MPSCIKWWPCNRSKGPCDVFDPWVRWERGQVGIWEFVRRRRGRRRRPEPLALPEPLANSWKYFSPIKIRTKFLKTFFTHIRRSDSWKYFSPISVNLIIMHLSWIYCGSIGNLSWMYREPVPDASSWRIKFMKNMEFCLKWVHMARYELILRLDGALWLPIISGPLLTQKWPIKIKKWQTHKKKKYTFVGPCCYPTGVGK